MQLFERSSRMQVILIELIGLMIDVEWRSRARLGPSDSDHLPHSLILHVLPPDPSDEDAVHDDAKRVDNLAAVELSLVQHLGRHYCEYVDAELEQVLDQLVPAEHALADSDEAEVYKLRLSLN